MKINVTITYGYNKPSWCKIFIFIDSHFEVYFTKCPTFTHFRRILLLLFIGTLKIVDSALHTRLYNKLTCLYVYSLYNL